MAFLVPPLRQPLVFERGQHYYVEHYDQLPFTIIDTLGKGLTSSVEKVKDNTTAVIFARKIIFTSTRNPNHNEKTRADFEREVQLIQKARHHHVVQVFATYAMSDRLGLILSPAADEGDLSKFLKRREDLVKAHGELDIRVTYMNQILQRAFGCLAAGLEFMHGTGIYHKDIKPENILIHEGYVLYTDFGCSLDVSQSIQTVSDGRGGFTERYHPPEGFEREGRNKLSDVFSLGCVFLEVLSTLVNDQNLCPISTDAPPGERRTFASGIRRIHLRLEGLDLRSTLQSMPAIIQWMTQTHRESRPTADQVFQAIVRQPGSGCARCYAKAEEQYSVSNNIVNHGGGQIQSSSSAQSNIGSGQSLPRGQGACIQGDHVAGQSLYYESLDPSFYVRDSSFFTVGKVFAVMWIETASATATPTDYNTDKSLTHMRYAGNYVHTNVRRFIVVRSKREFCFACPIFTYSGRATLKGGVQPEQHAIAYSWGRTAQLLQGEYGITKTSICVVMTNNNPALDVASRIYFGMHHPVQYGVKVKEIGYVPSDQLATLIGNWREECP